MLRFTTNIIGQGTLDCNLRCKYCYENHDCEKGKYLDYNTFTKVFDTYVYNRCVLGRKENPIVWHFHGGEIFMMPWEELLAEIEYVEERAKFFPNISWCIQTNGLLITDEIAEWFSKKEQSIGFSFDGYNTENRMSKEANIKLIEKLRDFHEAYGTRFSCLMVLSKDNMKTWFEDACSIMDFCDNVGINLLCDLNDDNIPTPEEQWDYWIKPVLDSLLTDDPLFERNVETELSKTLEYMLFNIESRGKTGCFDRLCAFGTNMIAITPHLQMHGCDKFLDKGEFIKERKSFSVFSRDFLGINAVNNALKHYKKVFKEEKKLGCDFCPAKWLCPGECQSYNISRFGDVKISDNMCEIYNRVYDFVDENWTKILLKRPIRIDNCTTDVSAYALARCRDEGLELHIDNDGSSDFVYVTKKEKEV